MTIKEEIQIEEYKRTFAEAYKQGFIDAINVCKTEPTISKMEQVEGNCTGCKFIDTYDTEFPCVNCSRKIKDYYAKDEPQTERKDK